MRAGFQQEGEKGRVRWRDGGPGGFSAINPQRGRGSVMLNGFMSKEWKMHHEKCVCLIGVLVQEQESMLLQGSGGLVWNYDSHHRSVAVPLFRLWSWNQ